MRIHKRISFRSKIDVYRIYDAKGQLNVLEEPIHLEVFDISLGGLGVLSKRFQLNASMLEFTLYVQEIPYRVIAKVVWHETNEIFHRYGLEIIGHNNMLFRYLKEMINGQGSTIDTYALNMNP
ncbi:MAG: PilZ domain-containing protein [Clostridia bacterium]|nr:PilZ domain-containing protein [Clostridia bacterium]